MRVTSKTEKLLGSRKVTSTKDILSGSTRVVPTRTEGCVSVREGREGQRLRCTDGTRKDISGLGRVTQRRDPFSGGRRRL